jgi:hypothetical protein
MWGNIFFAVLQIVMYWGFYNMGRLHALVEVKNRVFRPWLASAKTMEELDAYGQRWEPFEEIPVVLPAVLDHRKHDRYMLTNAVSRDTDG